MAAYPLYGFQFLLPRLSLPDVLGLLAVGMWLLHRMILPCEVHRIQWASTVLLFPMALVLSGVVAAIDDGRFDVSFGPLARSVFAVLVFCAASGVARKEGFARRLTYAWLASGTLVAILAIAQVLAFNLRGDFRLYIPPTNLTYERAGNPGVSLGGGLSLFRGVGTLREPPWLATFLSPILIGCAGTMAAHLAAGRRRLAARLGPVFLILAAGVISSLSLVGWLSAAIALGVVIAKVGRSKRAMAGSMLTLGVLIGTLYTAVPARLREVATHYVGSRAGAVVGGRDPSLSMRVRGLDLALRCYASYPILGAGPNRFPHFARSTGHQVDVTVNNSFLLLAAETGTVGLTLLLVFGWRLFSAAVSVNDNDRQLSGGNLFAWAGVGFLLANLFNNHWYALDLWISAGVLSARGSKIA